MSKLSSAGGPKDRRRALEKELLGHLWEGKVDTAVERLRGAMEWVRNPRALEDLIGYLEKRREYIPDYQERQPAGGTMDREHAGGEIQRLGGLGSL